MKIKPIGSRIYIKVDEPSIGALDTSSFPTAVECAEVIAVGDEVKLPVKKGDKLFYKSWSVDIISFEGKRYHFIDEATKGICAIIS